MSVYEVKAVQGEPREWTSSHGGTFLSYKVDLQEQDGPLAMGVEWNKKPESQPPKEGEVVAGHLEEGKYGDKFKIDYDATKELGRGSTSSAGSSNAGGRREWKPESSFDPEKTARIGRAHAQHMAILTCDALGCFEGNDSASLHRHLKTWTDYFAEDVNQAGQAAVQAQGSPPPAQEGAAPSPSASPGSEQQPADDTHQYFCKLLEDAGLNSDAARVLATFIVEKFDNDQRRRAETGLKHLDTQKDTLDKARYAYEKGTGELLPDPSDDDSIPF